MRRCLWLLSTGSVPIHIAAEKLHDMKLSFIASPLEYSVSKAESEQLQQVLSGVESLEGAAKLDVSSVSYVLRCCSACTHSPTHPLIVDCVNWLRDNVSLIRSQHVADVLLALKNVHFFDRKCALLPFVASLASFEAQIHPNDMARIMYSLHRTPLDTSRVFQHLYDRLCTSAKEITTFESLACALIACSKHEMSPALRETLVGQLKAVRLEPLHSVIDAGDLIRGLAGGGLNEQVMSIVQVVLEDLNGLIDHSQPKDLALMLSAITCVSQLCEVTYAKTASRLLSLRQELSVPQCVQVAINLYRVAQNNVFTKSDEIVNLICHGRSEIDPPRMLPLLHAFRSHQRYSELLVSLGECAVSYLDALSSHDTVELLQLFIKEPSVPREWTNRILSFITEHYMALGSVPLYALLERLSSMQLHGTECFAKVLARASAAVGAIDNNLATIAFSAMEKIPKWGAQETAFVKALVSATPSSPKPLRHALKVMQRDPSLVSAPVVLNALQKVCFLEQEGMEAEIQCLEATVHCACAVVNDNAIQARLPTFVADFSVALVRYAMNDPKASSSSSVLLSADQWYRLLQVWFESRSSIPQCALGPLKILCSSSEHPLVVIATLCCGAQPQASDEIRSCVDEVAVNRFIANIRGSLSSCNIKLLAGLVTALKQRKACHSSVILPILERAASIRAAQPQADSDVFRLLTVLLDGTSGRLGEDAHVYLLPAVSAASNDQLSQLWLRRAAVPRATMEVLNVRMQTAVPNFSLCELMNLSRRDGSQEEEDLKVQNALSAAVVSRVEQTAVKELLESVDYLCHACPNLSDDVFCTMVNKLGVQLPFAACVRMIHTLAQASPPPRRLLTAVCKIAKETWRSASESEISLLLSVVSKQQSLPELQDVRSALLDVSSLSDVASFSSYVEKCPRVLRPASLPLMNSRLFELMAQKKLRIAEISAIFDVVVRNGMLQTAQLAPIVEFVWGGDPASRTAEDCVACLEVFRMLAPLDLLADKELEIIARGFASMPMSLVHQVDALQLFAVNQLTEFGPLSNKLIATAETLTSPDFVRLLLSLSKMHAFASLEGIGLLDASLQKHLPELDGRALCTVFKAVSSEERLCSKYFKTLVERLDALCPLLSAEDVGLAMSALASCKCEPEQVEVLVDRLSSRLLRVMAQAKKITLINALHCLSQFHIADGELVTQVLRRLVPSISRMDGNALATTSSAVASLEIVDDACVVALARQAGNIVSTLTPRNLVVVLRALCELDVVYCTPLQRLFSRAFEVKESILLNAKLLDRIRFCVEEHQTHLPSRLVARFLGRSTH